MTTLAFTMICGIFGLFEEDKEGRLTKTFRGLVFICFLIDIIILIWMCNKKN